MFFAKFYHAKVLVYSFKNNLERTMAQYTEFAPAERLSKEEILEEYQHIFKSEIFENNVFHKIPIIILILNKFRQVIFANDYFKKNAKIDDLGSVLGLRPGEIFNCIYSDMLPGGCGTTKFCEYCGAVNAILASIRGISDIRECTITQKDGTTLFLEVSASPVEISSDSYLIFTIKDISDEKRKLYLEKQVLNKIYEKLSEIKLGSSVLTEIESDNEIIKELDGKINKLVEDIKFQKLILDAENYNLQLNPIKIEINSYEFLEEIIEKFYHKKHQIIIEAPDEYLEFLSDYNLIFLSLKLLIEYGLETISANENIKISLKRIEDNVVFIMKLPKIIPESSQYKIFQKDYLGNIAESNIKTYLINLIVNRYLKGEFLFETNGENETVFTLRFPLNLNDKLNLYAEDENH
jgi:hypothetical protein